MTLRRGWWALVAATGLLLALPGPPSFVFAGAPFSSWTEIVILGLLVAVNLGSGRERLGEWLEDRGTRVLWALILIVLIATGVKAGSLLLGQTGGFDACYRSPQLDDQGCGASYEDPWGLSDGTRIDRTIDFESGGGLSESNWNLGFLNDLRLNFFLPEEPSRERLPFTAEWTATMSSPRERNLEVTYVGELEITVDGEAAAFADAYESSRTEPFTIPAGSHDLVIEYAFLEDATAAEPPSSPYAAIEVSEDGEPLTNPPSTSHRILGWIVDAAVIAIGLLLLGTLILILIPLARLAAIAIVLAGVALFAPQLLGLPLTAWLAFVAMAWALGRMWPVRADRTALFVLGFLAISALVLARELLVTGSIDAVVYRGGGHDFLTYESHARDILAQGSLQGGEDVFVYSPGFRYLVFLLHLIFGEGDVLPPTVALVALISGAGFLVASLANSAGVPRTIALRAGSMLELPAPKRKRSKKGKPTAPQFHSEVVSILTTLGVVFLILVCTSGTLASMVRSPLSEYPTWIFLLFAIPLLFVSSAPRHWAIGAVLLGFTLTVRSEQGIAVLVMLAAFVALRVRHSSGNLWWAGGIVVLTFGVALFPALHNLYYGSEFALLPSTPNLPVNFPLPLSKLGGIFSDPETRAILVSQFKGVLYWEADPAIDPATFTGRMLAFSAHTLQLLWLVSIGVVLKTRTRLNVPDWLILLLPVAYLLPHVFIQVYVYYPRHIVAGYIALAVASMWILRRAVSHGAGVI